MVASACLFYAAPRALLQSFFPFALSASRKKYNEMTTLIRILHNRFRIVFFGVDRCNTYIVVFPNGCMSFLKDLKREGGNEREKE